MSAASASAAGAAATGNQAQNQLLGSGPMGAGLNLYGPNLTQTPGFFHNLLTNPGDTMQQINNNPGGMYGTGTSNVGANAAIAQGDPNNVTAEGFGTNTGATGVGGVANTYGAPPPMGGIGGFSTMPEVNFNVGTQNAMGGIYGNEQQRQASVGTDVLNTETLDPARRMQNKNLRLKGLI